MGSCLGAFSTGNQRINVSITSESSIEISQSEFNFFNNLEVQSRSDLHLLGSVNNLEVESRSDLLGSVVHASADPGETGLMGGCISADADAGDKPGGVQIITSTNIRFSRPSFFGNNKVCAVKVNLIEPSSEVEYSEAAIFTAEFLGPTVYLTPGSSFHKHHLKSLHKSPKKKLRRNQLEIERKQSFPSPFQPYGA